MKKIIFALLLASCGQPQQNCLGPQYPIANGPLPLLPEDVDVFLNCPHGSFPDYSCAFDMLLEMNAEMADWQSFMVGIEVGLADAYETAVILCEGDSQCINNANCDFFQQNQQLYDDYKNGLDAIRDKYAEKMKVECCYDEAL